MSTIFSTAQCSCGADLERMQVSEIARAVFVGACTRCEYHYCEQIFPWPHKYENNHASCRRQIASARKQVADNSTRLTVLCVGASLALGTLITYLAVTATR